jgi:type VI secretion system Hcp family effector
MADIRKGFVKIGDFEGESTDSKYTGWSLIYRLSAPITRMTGGFEQSERGVGASALVNAVVIKDVDSASVKVQKACASGQKLAKVKVDLCTTLAGVSQPYLSYELENVIITGYDLEDPIDAQRVQPTERVTFSYTKATWTYVKYGTDGASQGKVTESYSIGAKSS